MSEPFLSEIKLVSFNFPPKGWTFCNGQLLPINQNQALFALLGTTYGGNGQTNFALPNLRGRIPIHMGGGHTLGEAAGSTSVTINIQQLPTHIHQLSGRTDIVPASTNAQDPTGKFLAGAQVALQGGNTAPVQTYAPPNSANLVALNPQTCTNVGGSQPHNNMMPYLVLNFIIALQGIFPSQN
jgi:microcystin-dependent protein